MLFYCVGETLQDMAVDKARDNIRSLMEFHPKMAVIVRGNHKVADKPENVIPGEIIEVKPGERVPLDGILTSGDAAFNTAALTGESMPRTIENGHEVLAGMIATESVARIKVTRPESESAVARILKMVEEASERKAPAELFIRKFARIYTPAVIALAALTVIVPYIWSAAGTGFVYDFSTWFYRALIFLVISCPCALVISIPLSYFAGIGAASRHGILFKGGNWLDAVTHIDTVVFDKTGTLTRGVFSVTKVCGNDTGKLLATVVAMGSAPIAGNKYHAGDRTAEVSDVKDLPGYGMTATAGGDRWLAGTLRLLDRENVSYPEELKSVPETIVVMRQERPGYEGYITTSRQFKDDAAAEAVRRAQRVRNKPHGHTSGDKQWAPADTKAAETKVDKDTATRCR